MYMHAAQSFIWNNAASERVRMHGLRVVEGDLVLPNGPWPDGGRAAEPLPDTPVATDAADDAAADEGGAKRRRKDCKNNGDTANARIERAVRVTAADVEAGKYSLEEVVLPMPGGEVEYPPCMAVATGDPPPAVATEATPEAAAETTGDAEGQAAAATTESVYDAIARRAGVSLTAAKHGVREFDISALTGDYRRLVTVPRAMRMMFVEYEGLDDEICGGGVELLARWNPGYRERDSRHVAAAAELEEGDHLPPPPPPPRRTAMQTAASASEPGEGGSPAQQPPDPPTGGASADAAPETGGPADADGPAAAVTTGPSTTEAPPTDAGPAADGAEGQGAETGPASADKPGGTMWKLLEDASMVEDGKTVVQCPGGFREAEEERDGAGEDAAGATARLGVVLTFALPASSYATMLTRELLKASTAVKAHMAASAAAAAGAPEAGDGPAEAEGAGAAPSGGGDGADGGDAAGGGVGAGPAAEAGTEAQ